MKISAVVLNWNRPDDTVEAVNSILNQDYPDFEVIIWDNASSDNSRDVLSRAFKDNPRIRMFFAPRNYGVAGGRNRAAREAAGDVLFFLDSDAHIRTATAFSRVADRLSQDHGLGALSFEVVRPDGFLMWPFARPADIWRHREFEVARVDGCAFAVLREAFDKAGAFAEHFSPYGAEDLHFAYKLIDAGYEVHYFPSAVAVHAFSPAGRTGIQFTMHVRNMLLIPLELFPFPHALASYMKTAVSLGRDAWVQHQRKDFLRGLCRNLCGFNPNDRIPISPNRWRYLRSLVEAEKESRRLIRRQGNWAARLAGQAWFYLRVCVLFLLKAAGRLAAYTSASRKPAVEARLFRFANRIFSPPLQGNLHTSMRAACEAQDTSDFFGLAKRVKAGSKWFLGKRLLDIGCGLGKYSQTAASKGAVSVCGIDVEKNGVEFAKRIAREHEIANVSYHVMSVYDLQFPDNTFDGAFSHTVFEHLADIPRALAEIHRVLKPGGEFVFTFDAFRSRHGAHVGHFIGVPWPCFFFDISVVTRHYNEVCDRFLAASSISGSDAEMYRSSTVESLNRMKISDVEEVVRQSPFKVVGMAPYNEEALVLSTLPFLKKIPSLYEYLRGSLVIRLQKP